MNKKTDLTKTLDFWLCARGVGTPWMDGNTSVDAWCEWLDENPVFRAYKLPHLRKAVIAAAKRARRYTYDVPDMILACPLDFNAILENGYGIRLRPVQTFWTNGRGDFWHQDTGEPTESTERGKLILPVLDDTSSLPVITTCFH